MEPRVSSVSSALNNDNDDLADLATEIDKDSPATLLDLPLRLEEVVFAPTLAKAAASLDEEKEEASSALLLWAESDVVAEPEDSKVAALLDL